jgi:hypothetical protein
MFKHARLLTALSVSVVASCQGTTPGSGPPPRPRIVTPLNNASILCEPLRLEGSFISRRRVVSLTWRVTDRQGVEITPGPPQGSPVLFNQTLTPGTYTVTLEVRDDQGATGRASVTITRATGSALDMDTDPNRRGQPVGGGLQRTFRVTPRTGAPSGAQVRLTSSNAALLRVSSDPMVEGTDTAVVTNSGAGYVFAVQGMEGQSGPARLTATAGPDYCGTAELQLVPAAVEIIGLASRVIALREAFSVSVGLPSQSSLVVDQTARGGPGLTVTVTSSQPQVGMLETPQERDASVLVVIPPGRNGAGGGTNLAFVAARNVNGMQTDVSASIPGGIPVSCSLRRVCVGPACPALPIVCQ